MSQIVINLNNNISEEEKDEQNNQGEKDKPKRDTTSKAYMVFLNQSFDIAKNLIVTSVEASYNRQHSLYEDYIGEQTSRNYSNVIKKASAIAVPLAMGHPVIALGVVALDVVNSYNKYVDAIQKLNTTDYNTNFGRVRAGLVDNGKGTEN